MSFAVATTNETPQATTVAGFTLVRVGAVPALSVRYVESVQDVIEDVIQVMVPELDIEGAPTGSFSGCVSPRVAQSSGLLNQELFVAGQAVATVEALSPGNGTVHFAQPSAADLTGETVRGVCKNVFGTTGLRPSAFGRAWELSLTADKPLQRQRMMQLMGSAHVKAVLAVMQVLGVSKTVDEVVAAVMACPDNLESLLATEFEALELGRRDRSFTDLGVAGNAP
jgi:hypothetical protein